MRKMDLSGQKYGELTVLERSYIKKSNGMSYYLCICSCGLIREVSHGNLRTGNVKSCGCKSKRFGKDNSSFVHGFPKKHKTYKSWCKIKERCFNPNDISFYQYGAKGISMSETLKNNFLAFYAEVGEPPGQGSHWSIDRIDNSIGYVEGNLRWATPEMQGRNKSIQENNTTGVTGVGWYYSGELNHTTYAVATWSPGAKQKPKNKKFSCKKLGIMVAFRDAVLYRRKMIEELNTQGAGYTENHGK